MAEVGFLPDALHLFFHGFHTSAEGVATLTVACLLWRAIAAGVTPAEVDHSGVPEHSPNHFVLSSSSTHTAKSCDPLGYLDLACETYTVDPALPHRYTSDDPSFPTTVSSVLASKFSCPHSFVAIVAL